MNTFGVTFTDKSLETFKDELSRHDDGDQTFIFGGKRWLVSYARILAEFLTGTFMAYSMTNRPLEYKGDD
jgi:hypothetical protein